MLLRLIVNGLVLAVFLAACSDRDPKLSGERLAVLESDMPQSRAPVTQLATGAPRVNAAWTHVDGDAQHSIEHPALNWPLQPVWSVQIGTGNSSDSRIIGSPVVANGVVFVLDAAARVTAVSGAGGVLWTANLAPIGEKGQEGFGGGLALDAGRLLVTTGFGELLALSPASGGIIWRQQFDAALRAAPTAANGMVYVVARNDVGYGVVAETGRLDWSVAGAKGVAGLLGGASPAVTGDTVVFPFASGQLVAVQSTTGNSIWQESLDGGRRGFVRMTIGDISSDPVIANGRVYAATQSGQLAANDVETGARLWSLGEGAYGPVWAAGDSVFLVSDENELLRVNAAQGAVVWRVGLPGYAKPDKREHLAAHYGPVLAGGRLIVASSDGVIRGFDPTTGALLEETAIEGGAASHPTVAGGVLFVVSASGVLHAFQ